MPRRVLYGGIWPALFRWPGCLATWLCARSKGYRIGTKLFGTFVVGLAVGTLLFLGLAALAIGSTPSVNSVGAPPSTEGETVPNSVPATTSPAGSETNLPGSPGFNPTPTNPWSKGSCPVPPISQTDLEKVVIQLLCAQSRTLTAASDFSLQGEVATNGESINYTATDEFTDTNHVYQATLSQLDGYWQMTATVIG